VIGVRRLYRKIKSWRAHQRLVAQLSGDLTVGAGSTFRAQKISVRGSKDVSIRVGHSSTVEASLVLERNGASIDIGDRTFIGNTLLGSARSISVGDDVLISFDVLIMDHDGHSLDFAQRATDVEDWARGAKDWTHVRCSPVRICDRSWPPAPW
jgi:acetyltransferase-like isoleucine patch superfamily enzyme